MNRAISLPYIPVPCNTGSNFKPCITSNTPIRLSSVSANSFVSFHIILIQYNEISSKAGIAFWCKLRSFGQSSCHGVDGEPILAAIETGNKTSKEVRYYSR
jgi:hypothetical protein